VKRLWLFTLITTAACAQEGAVENGQRLFRLHCAVPYCHGPEGTAGRAPKLIGHSQTINSMFKVITWGIPGTGMPEFTSRLKTAEIADLVAYVMTLGGAPAPGPVPAAPAVRVVSAEAKEGRALFFDAARERACGTCHELDGWGVPVGPDLAAAAADRIENLRQVRESGVRTARPAGGEPAFSAVVAEQSATRVRVYDLTAPLPVLRSFAAGQVALSSASVWRHEDVTRGYSDAELDKVREFVRWAAASQ
jgi:mono/diheme cytochrome c family protein